MPETDKEWDKLPKSKERHQFGPLTFKAARSQDLKEHLFKVLVVGDIGTGKTSIIKRYVHGIFSNHYKATIGVDFALKVINLDPNTVVRLQLWDIAGQERFGNMTRVYYKEAVGAIIVFDVTRVSTFDAVQKWKADIDSKCDLVKEGLVKNSQQMDKYCSEKSNFALKPQGFAAWFETSAKESLGIEEAALSLVHRIIEQENPGPGPEEKDRIKVDGETKKAEGGGCCS